MQQKKVWMMLNTLEMVQHDSKTFKVLLCSPYAHNWRLKVLEGGHAWKIFKYKHNIFVERFPSDFLKSHFLPCLWTLVQRRLRWRLWESDEVNPTSACYIILGPIRCNLLNFSEQCSALQCCSEVQSRAMQCNKIQGSVLECKTVHYSAMKFSGVFCSAMKCSKV